MKAVDFAFLDSGTGGLPYMQYLHDACPTASCMYLADTKNFPYGEKTQDQINAAAISAVTAILSKYSPSAIVIACNTMSVTSLSFLRKNFPNIPFVGTVPAIKLAAKLTKNKRIGLLATSSTVAHPYTKQLENKFAHNCTVAKRGDPELVDFIEHALSTASATEIEKAIEPAVIFFVNQDVDIIILGCTHFLRIADQIQAIVDKTTKLLNKKTIRVIDSRDGVVRQAMKVAIKNSKSKIAKDAIQESFFYITGSEPCSGFYENIAKKHEIVYGGII